MAAHVGESTSGSRSIAGDGEASFQCNICFELPQEPIVKLCGHLFCWPCLYKWLHIHSHSTKCPVCKALVKEDKLVPLYGCGKDRVDPRSKNNVPGSVADIPHQMAAMAPQADPNRLPLTRMKRKRRRPQDDDTRSDDPPQLEVRNHQIPVKGVARSIYVVVTTWDTRPVYSLYKVDYPFDHLCSTTPKRQRLHSLATLESNCGKTFVPVETRHRKWIIAIEGCDSTIFDVETEEVIQGPNLLSAKDSQVLLAVEDKVYALFSFPKGEGGSRISSPGSRSLTYPEPGLLMDASRIAPGRSCLARLASRVSCPPVSSSIHMW